MANLVPITVTSGLTKHQVYIDAGILALINSPGCDPEVKKDVMTQIAKQLNQGTATEDKTPPVTDLNNNQKGTATEDKTPPVTDLNNNQKGTATEDIPSTLPDLNNNQNVCDTHTDPDIASTSENTGVHLWTDKEVMLLLTLRLGKENDFQKAKNHDALWFKITSRLNEKGIIVNKAQACNKYKMLKKKYREVLDANNKTGNEKVEWKFLDTFNDTYGHKASAKPKATFDSGLNDPEDEDKKKTPLKGSSGKGRKRQSDKVLEKVSEMNENLLKELQSHHAAKLQRLDRFIDIFEKKKEKE